MKNMIQRMALISKFICATFFLLFVASCVPFSYRKVCGTYIASVHENSIDTLFLYKNGTYRHLIYRANSNEFVYENLGEWEYQGGYVDLHDFVFNKDDSYYEGLMYYWDEYFILASLPVSSSWGEVRIDLDMDLGYYYLKVGECGQE